MKTKFLCLMGLSCLLAAPLAAANHEYFPEWKLPKVSPQKLTDWNLAKAFRQSAGDRTDISLNGFWKFTLAEKVTATPPSFDTEWGYLLVPSFWRSGPQCNFIRSADGRGIDKFLGKSYQTYKQGWYYREFTTPDECIGRQTLLRFEALFSKGIVILNGKRVALPTPAKKLYATSPTLSVDITGLLRGAGQQNTLYVATEPDRMRAGIQDNVWLCTRPLENFGKLRISTLVKAGKLRLDFDGGTLPKNFDGSVEIKIRDAKTGKQVHSATRPFAARLELDYVTPKLWSLDDPNLYFLDCALLRNGKRIDAVTARFGFRELTAEKGQLLLNGKPIMLNSESSWQGMWQPLWYTTEPMTRQSIRAMKFFGINSAYTQNMLASSFYDIADEEGFIAVEKVCLTYEEYRAGSVQECLQWWRSLAEDHVRSGRLDNHPSVAAILVDVYYGGSASGNNPAYIGLSKDAKQHYHFMPDGAEKIVPGGDPNLIGDQAIRSIKLNQVGAHLKDYFPDKEALTGAGGHVKDAYGVHIYHTWGVPFAELSALFQRYAKEPNMPIYCGEYAVPYHGAFADLGLWGKIRNKPEFFYWQENAARVLGPGAYREKTVTVPFAWEGAFNDLLASSRGRDGINPHIEYFFVADMFAKTLAYSVDNTIFHWRYDGLAGLAPFEYFAGRYLTAARSLPGTPRLDGDLTRPGVKPAFLHGSHILPQFTPFGKELDMRPNLFSTAFRQAMTKTTCKLMGAENDRYENNHAFWSGETLSKALGIVNMSGKPLKYRAEFVLQDASGAVVASDGQTVEMDRETLRKSVPFQLKLPRVGVRSEYTLRAVLTPLTKDSPALATAQAIQIFPARQGDGREIQLYGGSAAFADSLKSLGYRITEVPSFDNLDPAVVLVVAPGALAKQKELPDFSALAEKGIQTLIMEQHRDTSPELMKSRSRQAFINAASHPVLTGLEDVDFSDWRGGHSLDPAYGNPAPGHVWSSAQWVDWGNRGMVAGNMFRRPQAGNYLSLLAAGFDLFQTPLLEYRGTNGSWIGSQLEIGERLLIDPVATTVFCRMIDYLSERRQAYGNVGFFGGEKGRALLKKFGAEYRDIDPADPAALAGVRLLIVSDPDWAKLEKCSFQLSDYIYNGGKILYLHTGKNWYGSWLPFLMEMKKSAPCDKAVSLAPGNGLWLNGWSESELYWRGAREVPSFAQYPRSASVTNPAVLVQMKHGAGSYFFCALTPEYFPPQSAAIGKSSRLISALLTTHGVRLAPSASPYRLDVSLTLPLKSMRWEFALDPANKGLREKWQNGQNGSGQWLIGQQTEIGEFVRPGIGYEAFLERDYAGVSWYRLRFQLSPEQAAKKNMRLDLGEVNTADRTFLNGREIGSGGKRGSRTYRVPDGLLRAGQNTLLVRIENQKRPGGLVYGDIQLTNAAKWNPFWRRLYPGGSERDYFYNPDAIRQY